ncbi:oxidoreductase [Kineosporia sp. NBRC 101677]|uniref:FAD-dependent monooxygenase n=1 Tax=Kineosporia sp. NBRC 101677 TaxID=3032197 RepID=UPI0024A243FE|nr:FAD-dependent monooxygenase [Kineosporia sp. NBRC 101677]GLY17205.1 oxidoreductase [Kineosporia sp. NBRC 101677]
MRSVLISGASIAGPATAYWLQRAGFTVTVVERAPAVRGGGYPIDVRGTAVEVVRRMGLLPELLKVQTDSRHLTFLGPDGGTVAVLDPHAVAGSVAGRDLEVRRGDLAAGLYGLVRDQVEFRFGDAVETVVQTGTGAEVTFMSGQRRTFDLVVGADGMHSQTRHRSFGPEEHFHRYLGYCFALFTVPNTYGMHRELTMWNAPGQAAALYAVGERRDELQAFLTFHQPQMPTGALRDRKAQRDLVERAFAGAGWEVPVLLTALRGADDLFFDTAAQIRMPHWSRGRVVLVGDAAYAPSFLTGQGTSLALVGAYLLAYALDAEPDIDRALVDYEHRMRPFVTANQALVNNGAATLFPVTEKALHQRNARLQKLISMPTPAPRPAHSAVQLPDFGVRA